MEEYTYIDNNEKVIDFRKYLSEKRISEIAMDFEGEYNLHSYGEKLCLIQIYDKENFFIIDPLSIDESEIIKTLNNHKIVKYMYGIGSDMHLFYKQYGIKLNNIYDQKCLVDVLNFENSGLDDVIKNLFRIENNNKKYQTYNWQKRPLKEDAIIYALNDVKYLFEINKILMERIINENKVNDLIFRIIKNDPDLDKEKTPLIFKKKEYRELSGNKKQIFKKIYEVREHFAKLLNKSPNNILENKILFDIVNQEISLDTIRFNKGISKNNRIKIINKLRDTLG